MEDGTDTARLVVLPQLTGNRRYLCIDTSWQCHSKGPTRIRPDIASFLITSIARNDKKHLIDFAITIPVVDREIGLLRLTQLLNCCPQNIFAIIRTYMPSSLQIDLHRSVDIKLDIEAPSRLVAQIVCYAAYPHAFVIATLIEDAVVEVDRIGHREVGITTRNEYNRLAIGLLRVERLSRWKRILTSSCTFGRTNARITLSAGRQDSQRQHQTYRKRSSHLLPYYLFALGHQGFSVLKKSLPLSSTRIKAGKSSTSIFHTASIPSSGYSTHSMLLMLD